MMTVTSDWRFVQKEVVEWADTLLPDRQSEDALRKLLEEIAELFQDPRDPGELADVGILVLDLFHLAGVDFGQAVMRKLEVNRNREWKTGKHGIMRHV